MVFTFLSFVVVVGIIIFVHELGHFLAAKAVGIRVIRFSLGFPPKLIGKTVGDTEYCICWIPLGGYVKMAGMLDESFEDEDAISGEPWEFESKNALQKAFVICAGVVMNFILGMVIFSMIAGISGIPEAKDPMIGEVVPGYPAEQAGVQAGDLVTEVNGVAVSTWTEIVAEIHNLAGEESLTLQLEREGEPLTATLATRQEKAMIDGEIRTISKVGINPHTTNRPATMSEVLLAGPQTTWALIKMSALTIRMLATGNASVRDLAGPLFIAQMSGRTARSGTLDFLGFIGFISVNIGFLNILPIPVLDGGHLVYIALEAIFRRKIPFKIKLRIQQVGLALLLLLMVAVFYSDIMRIFID
jgi:regulator of sigma E protease